MADTPQVNTANTSDGGGASLAFTRFTSPSTADAAWCVIVQPDGLGGANEVDSVNPLYVQGTVTANLSATDNAVLDSIAAAVYVDDADWTDSTSSHVLTGGVYQSTPQSITDGDTGPLQVTANGYLITSVNGTVTVGSHDVTNAGTFAVQVDGAALTALQLIDDAIYTDDVPFTAGSNKVMAAGFRYDDTTPDAVTQGDVGYARMSAERCIYTEIRDAAGNERGLVIDASGYLTANINGTVTVDGSGVTQPVSGTVTANAGTGTFAISAATLPLPSGAASEAKQDTAITALQLIDNPVATISSTDVMRVAIFDNADSQITSFGGGTQYAVDDALGSTPTGTLGLAIRDDSLSALTPVEGDAVPLRVNSTGALHVTGGGGGSQYNVDDASGGTDTGTVCLVVRDDSLSALTPADGDYTTLRVNSQGALHVTGGGGGTEYAVDDALGATPTGSIALAKRDDALSALTPIEGDAVELRTDANGALWVIPSGTVTVDGSGVTQPVSGTITANAGTGNFNVNLQSGSGTDIDSATLSSTTGLSGGITGLVVNAVGMFWDAGNSEWRTMHGDQTNGLLVNLGSNNDVTVSGTVTANAGTGTFTVDLGANNDIQGDVAHDSADSGNPIKIGAKVETTPSTATMAADADRTDLYADADGILLSRPGYSLGDLISERVSNTDGASTAFTNFGATASTRSYVTAIVLHNSSATDGYVDFRDGTAGSVLFTVPVPAGGGAVITNGGAPLFKTTANTALAYDVSAALSTIYISVSGFKSKVVA